MLWSSISSYADFKILMIILYFFKSCLAQIILKNPVDIFQNCYSLLTIMHNSTLPQIISWNFFNKTIMAYTSTFIVYHFKQIPCKWSGKLKKEVYRFCLSITRHGKCIREIPLCVIFFYICMFFNNQFFLCVCSFDFLIITLFALIVSRYFKRIFIKQWNS